jgi:hypothetical protein
MQRFPLFSILLCLGTLWAGAAGALESEGEHGDVAQKQPAQTTDLEAARGAAISFEMLRVPALALASGFDQQALLRSLRLADPTGSDDPEQPRAEAHRSASDAFAAIPMLNQIAEAGLGTRPFSSQWYTSSHAESFPLARLERVGFFGTQQKYRTLRGSIFVGFEAGAAVRLRHHLNLTAGYRMLGYGLGEQSTLEGGDIDAALNAPFLGLALNY